MLDIITIRGHQDKVSPKRDAMDVGFFVVDGWRGRLAEWLGANASYRVVGDRIGVPEYLSKMATDPMYAPTITHELTHAAQRVRHGVVLYMVLKVFARWKLEHEAVAEEKRAQEVLGVAVLD